MLGRKLGEVHINREGAGSGGGGGGRNPTKSAGFRKDLQESRAARGETQGIGSQRSANDTISGSSGGDSIGSTPTAAQVPDTQAQITGTATPAANTATKGGLQASLGKTKSTSTAGSTLGVDEDTSLAGQLSSTTDTAQTGATGTSIKSTSELSFAEKASVAAGHTKASLAQLDDTSVATAIAAPGGFAIPAKAVMEGLNFGFGSNVRSSGSGAQGGERGKEGQGSNRSAASPTSVSDTLGSANETAEQRAERLKQRRLAGSISSTGSAGAAAATLFGS